MGRGWGGVIRTFWALHDVQGEGSMGQASSSLVPSSPENGMDEEEAPVMGKTCGEKTRTRNLPTGDPSAYILWYIHFARAPNPPTTCVQMSSVPW